jgi:hypothetical protein
MLVVASEACYTPRRWTSLVSHAPRCIPSATKRSLGGSYGFGANVVARPFSWTAVSRTLQRRPVTRVHLQVAACPPAYRPPAYRPPAVCPRAVCPRAVCPRAVCPAAGVRRRCPPALPPCRQRFLPPVTAKPLPQWVRSRPPPISHSVKRPLTPRLRPPSYNSLGRRRWGSPSVHLRPLLCRANLGMRPRACRDAKGTRSRLRSCLRRRSRMPS